MSEELTPEVLASFEDKPLSDVLASQDDDNKPSEEDKAGIDLDLEGGERKEETQGNPQPEGSQPQPYSAEEIEDLISQGAKLDQTRVTPEMNAVVTAVNKAYQKKFTQSQMEIAERKRALEAERQKAADPRTQQYVKFKENPKAYVRMAEDYADQLEQADPYNEENIRSAKNIRRMVRDFQLDLQEEHAQATSLSTLYAQTKAEINSAVENFEEKIPALNAFAEKHLGLSVDDLTYLADPVNTGPLAAKLTIALDKMYRIVNGEKTSLRKEVKPEANKLTRTSQTQRQKTPQRGVKDILSMSLRDVEREYGGG